MNPNLVMLSTLNIEELPLHLEPSSIPAMRPSAIEEDEDDPRSLLYLFDDNDFERAAAAYFAIEEACQHAQARTQALAEAEAQQRRIRQQQRTQALAACLEQLLEEDDELVDLLGKRILAMNGHQLPDIWQPAHQHHHHLHHHPRAYYYQFGAHYHPHAQHYVHLPQVASSSRASHTGSSLAVGSNAYPRKRDVHASWNDVADQDSLAKYAPASPFIHAAPVILQGRSPFGTSSAEWARASPPRPPRSKSSTAAHERIAIHPLTGVPMLLVQEQTEEQADDADVRDGTGQQHAETDDETDETHGWPVEDEQDLEWLGRELLRRQGGANVWVLGADSRARNKAAAAAAAAAASAPSVSRPTSTLSSTLSPDAAAAAASKATVSATPTLPVEVEEVDSDHELADIARALDPSQGESLAASLNSPSHRIAAALAHAASGGTSATQRRTRQRAATVMSESEEEQLETVGRPVQEDEDGDEAASLNDRPRKSVKVVDRR